MVFIGFATCGHHNSQDSDNLKRDNAEISKILDAAILSEAPIDSFRAALQKVQSYPTVDSAWIDGVTFFVKYKHGGIVSWIAAPPMNVPTTKGEQQK